MGERTVGATAARRKRGKEERRSVGVLEAIRRRGRGRIHGARYRSASPRRLVNLARSRRIPAGGPLISIIITSPYVFEPVFTMPCRAVDAYWWRVYIRRGAPRRRCKVTSRSSISDHTGAARRAAASSAAGVSSLRAVAPLPTTLLTKRSRRMRMKSVRPLQPVEASFG